ncbi:hypothetical protein C7959_11527 [Orenia marismortui]|uniref:Dipeptidylpeptidase IV N-terminal domain-containing protein n=2 Tax=Orenia marismortui TaxID=46469 RepID=A0A4R8H709_9FIRM|nr:hypothetical protein C7959_11527 [Orenia marismortui]
MICSILTSASYAQMGKIVFSRNLNNNWDIWIYEFNSGKLEQVTSTVEDEVNPVWLEEGKIAYLRNGDIYIKDKQEIRITDTGKYRYLTFDYDNNRLLYSYYHEDESCNIGYYDLETKQEGILFELEGQQIHPSIANNRLYFTQAYTVKGEIRQEVYNYSSNKGIRPVVVDEDYYFYRPAISAKRKSLLFGSNSGLYISNSRGKKIKKLNLHRDYIEYPAWGSGNYIIFTTFAENKLSLAIYNLSSEKMEILDIAGDCREADWQ